LEREYDNLCLGPSVLTVPRLALVSNCRQFLDNPTLLTSDYQVRASVGAEAFRVFAEAIKGTSPEITKENCSDLFQLCEEFGFSSLLEEVKAFRSQHFSDCGESFRERIFSLEEQNCSIMRTLCLLQSDNASLRSDLSMQQILTSEVLEANGGLRATLSEVRAA
jgi:hypothetical protein